MGITRAMERLYLTNAVSRLLYGYERSNRLTLPDGMPQELMVSRSEGGKEQLTAGNTVITGAGMGIITALIDDDRVQWWILKGRDSHLALDLAPLENRII